MELFGHAKRELLQPFLPPENGIPSHDAYSRILGALDTDACQQWFAGFMQQFAQDCEGVLAVDGKIRRRSHNRAEGRFSLHLVSAWTKSSGWC